jgi:hypothetical protein
MTWTNEIVYECMNMFIDEITTEKSTKITAHLNDLLKIGNIVDEKLKPKWNKSGSKICDKTTTQWLRLCEFVSFHQWRKITFLR